MTVACALACACQTRGATCPTQPPLPADRGELYVLLEAYPPPLERLDFSATSIAARRVDGTETALQLELVEVRGPRMAHARRWARGRLSPGAYTGLVLHVASATLGRDDGAAALLVPDEPTFIAAPFEVAAGAASLLSLELDDDRSIGDGFAFRPTFTARSMRADIPQVAGYASDAASHSLSVFDPRTRRLVGIVPTGDTPRGLAIDADRGRAYVALAGADAIEVLDIADGVLLERLRLEPGDEPHELAITPAGDVLLVANHGSNTAAFVDSSTGAVLGRAAVGDAPTAILIDRSGQRAYVVNHRSDDITVLDVANRAVVSTIATDSAPVRIALDRDGSRLYVMHEGSPELVVYSTPEHAELARLHVGLGAGALQIDSATDLLYVAVNDPPRILVYDPQSFVPIDSIRVAAPISRLAIDGVEHALLALMPARHALSILDLTSRILLGVIDVGCAPIHIELTGARR